MDDKFAPREFHMVAAWFGATSICLALSFVLLLFISTTKTVQFAATPYRLYSALPPNTMEDSDSIVVEDARAKIIETFFKKHNAPLADYSHAFIQTADKYGLDWRLLPSISMQESNGGKKVITDSYNPFGFGIYGSKVLKFSSWEEGIQ